MDPTNPPSAVFQTQRSLPYPPAAVYAAFIDPARLARWWGPDGFTNTFEHFDLRPGGRWRFVMQGPDGTHYPNESEFMALEPGQRWVIRHVVAPVFTLTVTLQPDGEGTRLAWHQAFDDPKVAAAVRHIVEPSNEQNLDRLHRHLRGEL